MAHSYDDGEWRLIYFDRFHTTITNRFAFEGIRRQSHFDFQSESRILRALHCLAAKLSTTDTCEQCTPRNFPHFSDLTLKSTLNYMFTLRKTSSPFQLNASHVSIPASREIIEINCAEKRPYLMFIGCGRKEKGSNMAAMLQSGQFEAL